MPGDHGGPSKESAVLARATLNHSGRGWGMEEGGQASRKHTGQPRNETAP